MQKKYKSYYDTVKMLKRELPTRYPVSVRRVVMPQDKYGDCGLEKRKFIIRIEKSLPEWCAIDVILHEYSHCLSWGDKDGHGESWGIAYSEVYRKLMKYWDVVIEDKKVARIKL